MVGWFEGGEGGRGGDKQKKGNNITGKERGKRKGRQMGRGRRKEREGKGH